MLQPALSFSFSICSLMFSVLSKSTTNSNIYVQCSQLCFNSMTPYESNVNSLFTSLVDSSSIYNFSKFQISPPGCSQSDVVYGLFQCRGDLSSSNCKECVTSSISQLKTNCPVSTGGGIQLDGCFVKYDNSSFFGAEDKMEVLKRCGPSVGYNSDVLNRIDSALACLIAGYGKYFRSGDYGSIQGVAQCVQDLSVSDCQDCLSEARRRLRSVCETSIWGDMYLGKCYVRYVDQGNDNHAYNGSSSSNKSGGTGGGSINKIMKWVAVIIGIIGMIGGLTLAATCTNCYNINNSKKDIKSLNEESKGHTKAIKEVDNRVTEETKRVTGETKKAIAEEMKRVTGETKMAIEEETKRVTEETKKAIAEETSRIAYEADIKAHKIAAYHSYLAWQNQNARLQVNNYCGLC